MDGDEDDVYKQPRSGKVRCLAPECDKFFHSQDRARNRICPACSKKQGKSYTPRIIAAGVYLDGTRLPPPE